MENTVALVAKRERSPLRWQPKVRVSQFAWVRSNPVWGHYPCCRTGTCWRRTVRWEMEHCTCNIVYMFVLANWAVTAGSRTGDGVGCPLWRRLSVGHRPPWMCRRQSGTVRVAPPSSVVRVAPPSVEHCEGGATIIHHRDGIRTRMGEEA